MNTDKRTRGSIDYDERNMLRDDSDAKSDMDRLREKWKSEPIAPQDKDRMASRIRDLETEIANGMPTHTEMWKPTQENIQKHLGWEKANATRIEELKNLKRRLEPDNPNAGRVEHLRKQGEADKLAKWY